MKNLIRVMVAIIPFTAFSVANTFGQDTMRSVNRPTTATDSANYSDTSFLNNVVRQLIIEYKLAEMAQQNAEHPRIKAMARQIMGDNRESLERLLAVVGNRQIQGVEQQELDNIRKAAKAQSKTQSQQRHKGFTGNTATDSLGSGKTGSGNLEGEDTSMLNASRNDEMNENYSEQGEYLYDSESFLGDLEIVSNTKGNDFERQWLQMMVKLGNTKVIRYNRAIDASKDDQIRAAALAVVPLAKMDNERLKRMQRNLGPSESSDPNGQRRAGDDRINGKNAR